MYKVAKAGRLELLLTMQPPHNSTCQPKQAKNAENADKLSDECEILSSNLEKINNFKSCRLGLIPNCNNMKKIIIFVSYFVYYVLLHCFIVKYRICI